VSPVIVPGRAPTGDQPLSTQTVDAEEIARTVNATTIEDALKYQPAIFARRRHIGDTQAPITTRTSGVGSSARSLIYVDGVLISALIGNNNSTASPRWGMVTPSEVDHIDVRYGPFSAAYPGNSIGAVVEITTREPTGFEASASAAGSAQWFKQYATKDTYPTWLGQAAIGDRTGPFSWRLSYEHLDTEAQPLAYVTAQRPASPSAAGTPVSGAFADVNRTGQPIAVLGAGGLEHQLIDYGKLKLSYEPSAAFHASYLAGYFGNDDDADVQTYLREAGGAPVYAGTLNIGGFAYQIPASAFSNNIYRLTEHHWMQALTLSGRPTADLAWQATASLYDYADDQQRTPTGALPATFSGGPGTILDMGGTGWRTFDGRLTWRTLTAGYHYDQYRLGADRYATSDWLAGGKGALTAAARGKTETQALFVEDALPLRPDLRLTLGLRGEQWRAFDGFNFQTSPAAATRQPSLGASRASPKAVLAWTPGEAWRLTASAGLAYRFPTVSELYQAVTIGSQVFVPNPALRPERAVSTELSALRRFAWGEARLSVFTEDVDDALISQTTPTPVGGFASFVQNIDHVRSRGAEVQVDAHDVLPRLDLAASLTWVDSTITADAALPAAEGKRTPQVPRLRWTAVATWRATERLTLTTAARYSDRVFGVIDNSDVVGHTYQGFEGYFVVDARAVLRIDDHWQAALGVENAGDDKYFLFHPFPQRSVLAEVKYSY
jgi:iron complex outermembrane receptor protein